MRVGRVITLGWGATLLLATFSILAAWRLFTIGSLSSPAPPAEGQSSLESGPILALLTSGPEDYVGEALRQAVRSSLGESDRIARLFEPVLPPFLSESEAMLETLQIAHTAGVDGVVVRPDSTAILQAIDAVTDEGTLTMVVGPLLPMVEATVRVGVDPTVLGLLVREMITGQAAPGSRFGYVCGLCAGSDGAAAGRLLDAAFSGLNPTVQRVDDADLGSIAAAETLLRTGVDVVFADTAEATLAIAQVVIDSNLVGAVAIYGFGSTDRILELVDDRVVNAVISADYTAATETATNEFLALLRASDREPFGASERLVVSAPPRVVAVAERSE